MISELYKIKCHAEVQKCQRLKFWRNTYAHEVWVDIDTIFDGMFDNDTRWPLRHSTPIIYVDVDISSDISHWCLTEKWMSNIQYIRSELIT